jgi:hypothetical protein
MNKYEITRADVIGEMHPLFKALRWVAAARSTDESRTVLQNLSLEKDGKTYVAAATDGRRLHVAEFDPGLIDEDFDALPAGSYEVIATTPKMIVLAWLPAAEKFPNWRSIAADWEAGSYEAILTSETIAHVCMKAGALIDPDFLTDAIGFGTAHKKGASVSCRFATVDKSGHSPLRLKHEVGIAYVMPLKSPGTAEDEGDDTPEQADTFTPDIPGLSEE